MRDGRLRVLERRWRSEGTGEALVALLHGLEAAGKLPPGIRGTATPGVRATRLLAYLGVPAARSALGARGDSSWHRRDGVPQHPDALLLVAWCRGVNRWGVGVRAGVEAGWRVLVADEARLGGLGPEASVLWRAREALVAADHYLTHPGADSREAWDRAVRNRGLPYWVPGPWSGLASVTHALLNRDYPEEPRVVVRRAVLDWILDPGAPRPARP